MRKKMLPEPNKIEKTDNRTDKPTEKWKLEIAPGAMIRDKRKLLGWKGVELARRSGVNPRTLDAIEKGRIESPSIRNLEAIARALGVSVASLFVGTNSSDGDRIFIGGNQKGQHTLEFSKDGFRIVSYTPFVPNFFVGKVILKGETRIERRMLPTSGTLFVQPIIGKLSVTFEGKDHLIREGNYVFFDGCFPHSFYNPQFKEAAFLLVTSPSFLTPNHGA